MGVGGSRTQYDRAAKRSETGLDVAGAKPGNAEGDVRLDAFRFQLYRAFQHRGCSRPVLVPEEPDAFLKGSRGLLCDRESRQQHDSTEHKAGEKKSCLREVSSHGSA